MPSLPPYTSALFFGAPEGRNTYFVTKSGDYLLETRQEPKMAASKRSQRVIKDGQERISFNSEDSVCGSARIWVAMPRT